MIIEYHRPEKLGDALKLLKRKSPATVPLGGGTVLSAPSAEERAVVDLQLLGLDAIKSKGKALHIGATATLQSLLETDGIPAVLKQSLQLECTRTLRGVATVAGTLVSADGRSPFALTALALDAQLQLEPESKKMSYGDLLPLRGESLKGGLISEITLPTNVALSYQYAARTPTDLPVLALALAAWSGGRTRLAVGGFGAAPHLALDGKDDSGLEEALENTLQEAADQWASAAYRIEAGRALLARARQALQEEAS